MPVFGTGNPLIFLYTPKGMDKIATPQDLQAELHSIMALIHASEKPDRQVIASRLNGLADKVAGVVSPTPAKLKSQLLSTANDVFSVRTPLRKMEDTLQKVVSDATGMSDVKLYDDAGVRKLIDDVHSLDTLVGKVANGMEGLARKLKK
jgi:hypothetical protein